MAEIPAPLLDYNLPTDDSVKASAFNRYFKFVFSTFTPTSLPSTVDKVSPKMNDLTFDYNGREKLLGSIKFLKSNWTGWNSEYCIEILCSYYSVVLIGTIYKVARKCVCLMIGNLEM